MGNWHSHDAVNRLLNHVVRRAVLSKRFGIEPVTVEKRFDCHHDVAFIVVRCHRRVAMSQRKGGAKSENPNPRHQLP